MIRDYEFFLGAAAPSADYIAPPLRPMYPDDGWTEGGRQVVGMTLLGGRLVPKIFCLFFDI